VSFPLEGADRRSSRSSRCTRCTSSIHGPGGQRRVASAGVSDSFLARYEREGREVDPLQAHLDATVCARAEGSALITVLELQRDRSEISAETLTALTPREREVALFVVDGLSDREIAERLCLSHHTVSQYVKRIYRKLDVASRVALTRLLLDLRGSSRRS